MKTIYVSAKDRLDSLYTIAAASGASTYEEVAESFSISLREEYGKNIDIDYEAISSKDMKELLAYIAEEEE